MGNTSHEGRNRIVVAMKTGLMLRGLARKNLELKKDYSYDQMPVITTEFGEESNENISISAGEITETRYMELKAELIRIIHDGIVPHDQCRAFININIRLIKEDYREDTRSLRVEIPLEIEQLPRGNWLAIHFGTSAVTVAYGQGEEIRLLPLQEVGNPSYKRLDPGNQESSSSYLLPSLIVCDADSRQNKNRKDDFPMGFPGYAPASLNPGDPSFVGLPATSDDIVTSGDRIVYSLVRWLGKYSPSLTLGEPITFMDEGYEKTSNLLPVEKVIESGLSALAYGYIKPFNNGKKIADQFVLTHPNTFTRLNKQRFHDIAYNALRTPFEIPKSLKKRIQLISESDAVAYYYCHQITRGFLAHNRTGIERILVYDFGAGTIDLSIIEIEWSSDDLHYPVSWNSKANLSVPVAGHYLDEILARVIDRFLNEEKIRNPAKYNYQYPIVDYVHQKDKRHEHTSAINKLWKYIKTLNMPGMVWMMLS